LPADEAHYANELSESFDKAFNQLREKKNNVLQNNLPYHVLAPKSKCIPMPPNGPSHYTPNNILLSSFTCAN